MSAAAENWEEGRQLKPGLVPAGPQEGEQWEWPAQGELFLQIIQVQRARRLKFEVDAESTELSHVDCLMAVSSAWVTLIQQAACWELEGMRVTPLSEANLFQFSENFTPLRLLKRNLSTFTGN